VIVYGATNLGYLFFGRSTDFASPRTQLWVFLFDIVAVSLLIVLRGSQVPQFIMAYFTLVLMAAVVQGLGSALVNAVFVSVVYAVVTAWGKPPDELLTFPVLSQFAFFVVVAVFMGQVAQTAREDARRRTEAEVLTTRLEAAVAERTSDLTRSLEELNSARDRLHASDRLATVGMLSAGIAHEIKNPLAAIRANLDEAPALLDEVEEGGAAPAAAKGLSHLRDALADCDAACRQLQRVAADLTDLSRGAPAEPTAVEPAKALEATARLLRHRAKDGLSIVVRATGRRSVLADAGRLQQVLVNLAGNGLDAMEGRGGALVLACEDLEDGRVRFTVEDAGCGISPEVKARLFQPFVTTKGPGKGTGLGLHLVREIAQGHGAVIDVDSTPGEGTRFRVDWPAAPETDLSETEGGRHDERSEDPAAGRRRRGDHPPGSRADLATRAV
jgi:signal transduction histidine kinase